MTDDDGLLFRRKFAQPLGMAHVVSIKSAIRDYRRAGESGSDKEEAEAAHCPRWRAIEGGLVTKKEGAGVIVSCLTLESKDKKMRI